MSVQNISKQPITEFFFRGFDSSQSPLAAGIVLLILYVLVLISNFATIYFIVTDKHLHQPMYLFVCNLAIIDIVHSTCACPTMIGILVVGYKTSSYVPCIVQMFIFHFCGIMEMLSISVMAFDRFVAINSPLRYHSILTNFCCTVITIAIWLTASAITTVLPATAVPLPICYSNVKYIFCDYATVIRATCADPEPYFNLVSILTTVLCFVTFSFIFLSYLQIFVVVVRMPSNSDKKKAFNTCVSHLIVIISFYAPAVSRIVLTRVGLVLTLEERNGLMIVSIIVPSLINPFIYCLKAKEIRNKIFKVIKQM